MLRVLRNLSVRIRSVRRIDMESGRRSATQDEHLAGHRRRGGARRIACGLHIERRLEQIVAVIREGYARI